MNLMQHEYHEYHEYHYFITGISIYINIICLTVLNNTTKE